MVAECFKLVIEYITMTAEAWFSLVVGEWRLYSVSSSERCIGNAI